MSSRVCNKRQRIEEENKERLTKQKSIDKLKNVNVNTKARVVLILSCYEEIQAHRVKITDRSEQYERCQRNQVAIFEPLERLK